MHPLAWRVHYSTQGGLFPSGLSIRVIRRKIETLVFGHRCRPLLRPRDTFCRPDFSIESRYRTLQKTASVVLPKSSSVHFRIMCLLVQKNWPQSEYQEKRAVVLVVFRPHAIQQK